MVCVFPISCYTASVFFLHQFFYILITFICLSCKYVGIHTQRQSIIRGYLVKLLLPFSTGAPGIELTLSGLATSPFTCGRAILPLVKF